jgi:prepilin-type N-terminal cleavage/methylation domain-containing protein
MMKSYKKGLARNISKGFTLIELLVVIAIIGILASIVLASLNSARSKGGDATVKSDLHSIQQEAELDNNNSCYTYPSTANCSAAAPAVQAVGTCPLVAANAASGSIFKDPTILAQINSAVAVGAGGAALLNSCYEPVGGPGWVVVVQLAADKGTAWCVDSAGSSKMEGAIGGTALTQATTNAFIDTVNIKCT